MNKAIIESIEWHKDQLFKLLEDDDLYKIEGSIHSVKSDLNEIIEKAKAKKRVWVKGTATKKGHYREQMVGREKEKGRSPQDPNDFRDPRNAATNQIHEVGGWWGSVQSIDKTGETMTLRGSKGDIKVISFDKYRDNGGRRASVSDTADFKAISMGVTKK